MVGTLQVSSLPGTQQEHVGLGEGCLVPSKQGHQWDKNNLSGATECQLGWTPTSQMSWQGEKPAVFGLVLLRQADSQGSAHHRLVISSYSQALLGRMFRNLWYPD